SRRDPTTREASGSAPGYRWHGSDDPRLALRRPGARPRRLPDDPQCPGRDRRRRRGRRRRRSGRAHQAAAAARRADGRAHARNGRDRGHPAHRPQRRREPGAHPHHFDLDEYVYQALRVGASGFLLKDVTAAQLVEGVRVVAAGQALLAPTVTRRLLERFAPSFPGADDTPPPVLSSLTEREREVLKPPPTG